MDCNVIIFSMLFNNISYRILDLLETAESNVSSSLEIQKTDVFQVSRKDVLK